VRDWACFALGEQWREVDSSSIRDALAARLDDADVDTRCEALVGLSYRRDLRSLPVVRTALERPRGDVWLLEMVAAGAWSDSQLHGLVLRHQSGWDDAGHATADAVRRLTDPEGPGDDLLDGVADLSRRRAYGRPDGDALAAWQRMNTLLEIAPYRAREFLRRVLGRLGDDPAAVHEVRHHSALAQRAGTNKGPPT
jgi:hypothetical protein